MLLKVTDVGEIESTGSVPVPLSKALKFAFEDASAVINEVAAAAVTLEASLVMVTSPEMLPADCGANVNCTVTL